MPRTNEGGAAPPAADLPSLFEASALTRSAYRALKAANHLLAHAEEGTAIDCNDLASLLVPIQERLWAAIDELGPVTGEANER